MPTVSGATPQTAASTMQILTGSFDGFITYWIILGIYHTVDYYRKNQERELQTLIATLFGLLEPLLILTMGVVVLVIVLAILLPIFDLNQLVR